MMALLIDSGTDFQERTDSGESVLFMAAASNDRATLKLILDMGLDVETRDRHGDTAIWGSCL